MDVTPSLLRAITEPLRLPLFDALEHGIARRDQYCEPEDISDPWFRAHLVRLHGRARLASLLDGTGWRLDSTVSNSGIHLESADGHCVHVHSSPQGQVPSPGYSATRRDYWKGYRQLSLLEESPAATGLNLLWIWEARPGGSVAAFVAHPIGTWPYEGRPRCDATAVVPHPIDDLAGFAVADDIGEQLVELNVDVDDETGGSAS